MQFKVPQNIDLEDRIVGPLTLIQFLYVLSGSLLIYIVFQSIGQKYFALFLFIAIPIGLLTFGMAFLKIQEQPLSHFIKAGLVYLSRPKLRLWQRQPEKMPILMELPESEKKKEVKIKKSLDKSELDQLAHILDTQMPEQEEAKKLGITTRVFEKMLKQQR